MTHETWQPSANRQDPQHMAAADISLKMRVVLHTHPKPTISTDMTHETWQPSVQDRRCQP